MHLSEFVKKIEGDSDMLIDVKTCLNKKEFINFLKKYNVENLFVEFQKSSGDLAADYWPWSNMSRLDRKNFFK